MTVQEGDNTFRFITWAQMAEMIALDTKPVLLKIDCEGCEWEALRSVVDGSRALMPDQIAVELHYQARGAPDRSCLAAAGETKLTQRALLTNGVFFVRGCKTELGGLGHFVAGAAEERGGDGAAECPPAVLAAAPSPLAASGAPKHTPQPPRRPVHPHTHDAQIAWMDMLWRYGGYHIVARHDHGGCFGCSELLLARDFRGPPGVEAAGGAAPAGGGGGRRHWRERMMALAEEGGGGDPPSEVKEEKDEAAAAAGTGGGKDEEVGGASPLQRRRQTS